MIEYLEAVIEKHPTEAYVVKEGEVLKIKTGDAWFDDLEDKAARGEEITFEDLGLLKEDADVLRKKKAPDEPGPPAIEAEEDVDTDDNYDGG